jgi:hypothetical protein
MKNFAFGRIVTADAPVLALELCNVRCFVDGIALLPSDGGAVRPGLHHPELKMESKNAVKQI